MRAIPASKKGVGDSRSARTECSDCSTSGVSEVGLSGIYRHRLGWEQPCCCQGVVSRWVRKYVHDPCSFSTQVRKFVPPELRGYYANGTQPNMTDAGLGGTLAPSCQVVKPHVKVKHRYVARKADAGPDGAGDAEEATKQSEGQPHERHSHGMVCKRRSGG